MKRGIRLMTSSDHTQIGSARPTLPGYDAAYGSAAVFDRSVEGRIRLRGADRATWLQGLITNDVLALAPGGGCYAAYLTPQGRMISDLRVLILQDSLLIDLPAETTPEVFERFERFVITEDVMVADETAVLGRLGIHGPLSAPLLAAVIAPMVEGAFADEAEARVSLDQQLRGLAEHGCFSISAASPHGGERFELILAGAWGLAVPGVDVYMPVEHRALLLRRLEEAGVVNAVPAAWDLLRLEAGTPVFGIDMTTETIPLEAGLDNRAISHTKGCYVGQEVIVRILHRGQGRVARKLVGLVPVPGEPLPPGIPTGADIVAGADRVIGRVTSSGFSPRLEQWIALGYVPRDHADPGAEVRVRSADRWVQLHVVEVPFVR